LSTVYCSTNAMDIGCFGVLLPGMQEKLIERVSH
jgi:hypothetical protein